MRFINICVEAAGSSSGGQSGDSRSGLKYQRASEVQILVLLYSTGEAAPNAGSNNKGMNGASGAQIESYCIQLVEQLLPGVATKTGRGRSLVEQILEFISGRAVRTGARITKTHVNGDRVEQRQKRMLLSRCNLCNFSLELHEYSCERSSVT